MTELSFTWDSRDLAVWRTAGVEKALARAVSKAGGDAIRFMKVGSSRLLRQRKRFRVSRVNKALPLTFPRGKAIEDLEWRMDVSGAAVPIVDFPHSQNRRGVSVAVNKGGRKLLGSAFVATMRSGHRGVFERAFRGAPRLPIQEVFSSRVSDVFHDRDFVPFVQAGAQVRFSSAFERLFALELKK